MNKTLKFSIIPSLAIALAATSPVSAQLLGGSGGGGLTGGLTGNLGGSLERTTGTLGTTGDITGSSRTDKSVDTRSGRVKADSKNSGSANGSILGSTDVLGNQTSGNASAGGSGSANGSLDAGLIGTDAVRSTASDVVSQGRGTVNGAVGTASGVASSAKGTAGQTLSGVSGAASAAANVAGNGAFIAQGSAGQLAAAGSGAASGSGMFAVEPGMPVMDAKGRVLGHVQDVQQTKSGVVQSVTMEVGNRTATLPAADFAGSGDVLFTGMSKSEVKSAAKNQENQSAE